MAVALYGCGGIAYTLFSAGVPGIPAHAEAGPIGAGLISLAGLPGTGIAGSVFIDKSEAGAILLGILESDGGGVSVGAFANAVVYDHAREEGIVVFAAAVASAIGQCNAAD